MQEDLKRARESQLAAAKRPVYSFLLLALVTSGLAWVASFADYGSSHVSAATSATLTIDAAQPVYPFKPGIRGVATNTPNWLWHGLWDRGAGNPCCPPGKTEAIIEATSHIEPGVVRFAGGRWVSNTGWSRDGSAPEDGAWTYVDPATGQSYSYLHAYRPEMVDAFAHFITGVGAEAVVQVNVCDNNIPMWQDLVRYANVERGYGFRYWEIGNEQTLGEEACGLDADSYAQRYAAYVAALKAVDPSIKLMGPVSNQPYYQDWEDTLVDELGTDLDVLAFHWYQVVNWEDDTDSFAYQGGSLASLLAYDGNVGTACHDGFGCPDDSDGIDDMEMTRWVYRRGVAEQKMGYINSNYRAEHPALEAAITEYGINAVGHGHPVNGNHIAAVWMADTLGRWAYNGLDMIVFFSLEDGGPHGGNSRGLLGINSGTHLDVRPTYYTEYLYAQHFGDVMVQSETSDPENKVVAWASTDSQEPGTLKLMLVNLSGDVASTQIQVSGFTPVAGQAYVMTSEDPTSMEDPESYTGHSTTINGVHIPDYEIANPAPFRQAVSSIRPVAVPVSQDFSYTLQPYSVVALTLFSAAVPAPEPAPGQPVATTSGMGLAAPQAPVRPPALFRPNIGASSHTLCAEGLRGADPCTD